MGQAISLDLCEPAKLHDLGPELFLRAGIMLPLQKPPPPGSKIRSYFEELTANIGPILLDVSRQSNASSRQLLFLFMLPTRTSVVRFAPKASHIYLDYGVYDMFRDVPHVALAAAKLEAKRVHVLGQLVQLSEERVRAFSFIDDGIIATMREYLAPLGLDFGMRIPSWYRTFKRYLAVTP